MASQNFLRYWLPVVFWAFVILAITITSGKALEPANRIPFLPFLVHFGEFLVFGFLLQRALASEKGLSARNALALAIILSFAYSALTEILQLYVPGRFFEYSDMLTNDLGALVGLERSIFNRTSFEQYTIGRLNIFSHLLIALG